MSRSTTSSAPKLQASTIFGAYRSIAAATISGGCFASNDSPQVFNSSDDILAIQFFLLSLTLQAAVGMIPDCAQLSYPPTHWQILFTRPTLRLRCNRFPGTCQ